MSGILLIFPPSLYRNFTPPLNGAYLGGALEQAGYEVKILDLSALNPPCSMEEAEKIAKEFKPLWIGLTLNVIFITPAYEFIKQLKKLNIPIVAGGPHPSLLAEEAVQNGCDIVVRGEGERTVVQISKALAEGGDLETIPGISYKNRDGSIRHNPDAKLIQDLDDLPLPAKHLFPKKWYADETPYYQVYGPIFSGRGCPANCAYCYKGVFGHGCRLRSAENVFSEMKHLNERYGVTAFEFMDDAFSADLERVDRLCDMILDDPDFSPNWQCTTRMDLTTRELLLKMKRAGCFRIFYGVESGDPETLDRVNKHLDLDRAERVLKWTREAGIKSIVGFMWGFPWDSPAGVRQSISYLRRIAPFTDEFNPLGILIPVPGTRIYNEYKTSCRLKNWWLENRFGHLYRSNIYFPYFQRRFYNDFSLLDDGFFPFTPEVKKMIRKGINFIGKHNLFRNEPRGRALVFYAGVLLSRGLFKLSPRLEMTVFRKLGDIKHRILGSKES